MSYFAPVLPLRRASVPAALLFAAAVAGIAATVSVLAVAYGWQKAALFLVAVGIGVVFVRSQFGFSYTWRVLVTHGDGRGIRAQMLWIGLCLLPFAVLTGAVGGVDAGGIVANVRPLTVGVVVGAVAFGVGMQLGGACTSGSLVGSGQGNSVSLVSLLGFVAGALWAASHIPLWQALPALPAFSFFYEWGGVGVVVMALAAGGVAWLTRRLPQKPLPSAPPSSRRMSLAVAAVWLAVLTTALLALAQQPWGILNGLTIAGGKALVAGGYEEIEFWDYWSRFASGSEVLHAGWFAHSQFLTTVGMVAGVFVAAVAGGAFSLRRGAAKNYGWAAAGGVLMGYGAQISYGCNIGSYISALSSGSAHGWLWLAFAFVGTLIGVRVRRWVRL